MGQHVTQRGALRTSASKVGRGEPRTSVTIVGSGFSGLCMAIKLREAGIDDFVILERAGTVGGTWRDNTYPGCACDVPSHLYSFSFEPYMGWSRVYAQQPEIQAYVQRCFDKYDIRRHVILNAQVEGAEFDGAGWRVHLQDGRVFESNALVWGTGALSNPAYPNIPGRESFQGEQFHSSTWNHDYDLTGKRVAVIGTGASTIQFLPRIQPKVGQLFLFQRTPPWILPHGDRPFGPLELKAFEKIPGLAWLYRQSIYWKHESFALAFTLHPGLMKATAAMARRHIRRSIPDPKLRELVTPKFLPGCKRVLMSNTYYPALSQPNVEVLGGAIAAVKEHAVVTKDGRSIEVDAIIYGTGFGVHEQPWPLTIYGRDGLNLDSVWKDGPQAYLGTTISGFPNLFVLTGPNTGLGHNSMLYMIESQVHYIMECIKLMRERSVTFVDVRESLQTSYNERIQNRLKKSVWSSGCASWYLDKNGKNTTLWPTFTFAFRARTRRFRPSDYELGKVKVRAVNPPKEHAETQPVRSGRAAL